MRKFIKPSFLFLIMIFWIVIMSGCFLLPKEEVFMEPPLKAAPKVTYELADVKRGTIEKSIECVGNFISLEQNDLSFKNHSGRLKKIHVSIGDAVEKGALMAELESDTLESQISQQEISIEKMKLARQSAEEKGMTELQLAQFKLTDLTNQLEIANDTLDSTPEITIRNLKDQVKQQEMLVNSTKRNIDISLKQSELDIKAAKLQLENLKQELSKTKMISPISGIVDFVDMVKEGDQINAYQILISVANPSKLQVLYTGDAVPEFILGMKVKVKVDEISYDGRVVITPAEMPENVKENMKKAILIDVENLAKDTDMGTDAYIHVVLAKKDNVIVIEKDLVHENGDRKFVKVLENGVKKERSVETGIESDTEIEIVKGLEEGEKVIE